MRVFVSETPLAVPANAWATSLLTGEVPLSLEAITLNEPYVSCWGE